MLSARSDLQYALLQMSRGTSFPLEILTLILLSTPLAQSLQPVGFVGRLLSKLNGMSHSPHDFQVLALGVMCNLPK